MQQAEHSFFVQDFNLDTSEYVGMSAYDKSQEQDNMKASIRLLKVQGYSAPKQLLRIFLLALSSTEMAMVSSMDVPADPSMTSAWFSPAFAWTCMDGKNAIIALLCGACGI